MPSLLDQLTRSLRETLAELQAQMTTETLAISALYQQIDRRAQRLHELECRAANIGDQITSHQPEEPTT